MAIVATNAVFIAVAAGSLAVRFRIRMTKSKRLETEDWLAMASFVSACRPENKDKLT